MLSICIPIYNVKVQRLVEALLAQASTLNIPYEILLIDDHSSHEYSDENTKLKGVTYLGLNENIGRARIRNMLVKSAKYEYLLFLDCDSGMVSSNFLKDYLAEAGKKEKVVCGGRIYRKEQPEKDKLLHWKYGKNKESKPASVRMVNPYQSFMTNNFLIEKKVLEAIPFDERIAGYGHEDTLLGYQLKKHQVPIKHIDNPILHEELQTNEDFLKKTECAVSNLKKILEYVNYDKAFIEDVKLLKYYMTLKKCGLLFIVRIKFVIIRPLLKRLLIKGTASNFLFDFYKLGYLTVNK